jgi:hypothetical protein
MIWGGEPMASLLLTLTWPLSVAPLLVSPPVSLAGAPPPQAANNSKPANMTTNRNPNRSFIVFSFDRLRGIERR